jgi:transposase
VVIRRQLKRRYVLAFFQKLPSCLVGIEACASSHHWSRELKAIPKSSKRLFNKVATAITRPAVHVPALMIGRATAVHAAVEAHSAGRAAWIQT